jgi:2-polyprenyl-6-hydroxyphenyl methylase / 3-demethylubiquinone-9 3-methyltransferase
MEHPMENNLEIDNSIYDKYGERWYSAYDDPVALLRAENKAKFPWILNKLRTLCDHDATILDVGCGGGFLSNELARQGYRVTGVDLSPESVKVAEAHDVTRTVKYEVADAFHLPYPDESFDALTAMDFLEHIDNPDVVIKEFARVLKPQGIFFFHTFNRNPLAWLVVIKLLEWFIVNTPKNMHIIRLFIKPKELEEYCSRVGLAVMGMVGIRPVFSSIDWQMVKTGVVSRNMKFKLTKGTMLSYMGLARKEKLQ